MYSRFENSRGDPIFSSAFNTIFSPIKIVQTQVKDDENVGCLAIENLLPEVPSEPTPMECDNARKLYDEMFTKSSAYSKT